jgi:hypothetical protein
VHTIIVDNLLYFTDYYGLQVYDISDASAPIKVGGIPLPGKATYFEMNDNYAYVCGDFGIIVVNVSNPEQPEAINYEFLDFRPYQLIIDDSVLYIAGIENLKSYSISNPETIELLDNLYIPQSTIPFAGIIQYNDYIYYSNELGMYAINVADPANLQVQYSTQFNTGGSCWGPMALKDDYLFVPTTLELLVYSLTNPASPELVYSDLPINHTLYDIVVEGNKMVINHRSTGQWTVFDITNPANPVVIYENPEIPTYYCYSLGTLNNDVLYILDNGQEEYEGYTIHLVDLSSVNNPVQIGQIESLPGKSRSVSIFEKEGSRYALVAQDNTGPEFETGMLRILNIIDPANPVIESTLDLPNSAVSVVVANDQYAFATLAEFHFGTFPHYQLKLALINIQDVTNPYIAEIYDNYGKHFGKYINSNMVYFNGYLYAVSQYYLSIFKETSGTINLVGSTNIYGGHGFGIFTNIPGYVFVGGGVYGFQMYNVENPTSPYMINYNIPGGTCWDAYMDDGIAYSANYDGGLSIFDVSQNIIVPLSSIDCVGDATSVVEMDDIAYVGLRDGRIQMFDVADPNDPQDMGWYITNGTQTNDMIIDVDGSNANLYVANELEVSVFNIASDVGILGDDVETPEILTTLHPNPADQNCNLELLLPDEFSFDVVLIDSKGRRVRNYMQGRLKRGNHKIRMNVANLPNGIYFVEIIGKKIKQTEKLIIKH